MSEILAEVLTGFETLFNNYGGKCNYRNNTLSVYFVLLNIP